MKIETELVVKDTNYEDGGLCKILSFDFPEYSGLSHGQIVSVAPSESNDSELDHFVLDSMQGKKLKITLEVI